MAAARITSPTTESFFDQHRASLEELGDIVGLPKTFTESLSTAVGLTQPWVQGDHTRPSVDLAVSVSQSEALQPVFDDLYLKRETPFPTGSYDHVIVPGAVQIGNNNRIQFFKRAPRSVQSRSEMEGAVRVWCACDPKIAPPKSEATPQ